MGFKLGRKVSEINRKGWWQIPAAIAGSALMNKLASGDSKSTTKNQVTPAPMEGYMQQNANDLSNTMYGQFDARYYLEHNPDVLAYYNANIAPKENAPPWNPASGEDPPAAAITWAHDHYNKYGQYEKGRKINDPAKTEDYKDRIAEDVQAGVTADKAFQDSMQGLTDSYISNLAGANTQYGDKMGGVTDAFTGALKANTGQYVNKLVGTEDTWNKNIAPTEQFYNTFRDQPINTFSINLPGNTEPLTWKSASGQQWSGAKGSHDIATERSDLSQQIGKDIYGAQTARDTGIYGADSEQAKLINQLAKETGSETFDKRGAMAALVNSLAFKHLPNETQNMIQNFLISERDKAQNLRYGTPSTTQTQNDSYNPGASGAIGDATSLAVLGKMFGWWGDNANQVLPGTISV